MVKTMKNNEYACQWCPRVFNKQRGASKHESYAHPKEYGDAQGPTMVTMSQPANAEPPEDAVLGVNMATELAGWIAKYGAQIELYQRKIEELRRYESDIAELRVQQEKLRRWLDELTHEQQKQEQGIDA